MATYESFVRDSTVSREELELFLDPDRPTWAQFDGDVGYILGNSMPRDGIDGSSTISTVMPNGARQSVIYADRPCRINIYGNSFTQCHQVSDEETWSEYLAAHLGEPIRNFGMGGFGVYQSYRRMLRTEQTADAADNIMLYVWGDDHFRSCLRCRHVLMHKWWDRVGGKMFHGNFWANIEMDLATGTFAEQPNRCPTPESLLRMADPEFMMDALADDLMLRLWLFAAGHIDDLDLEPADRLAEILDHPPLRGDLDAQRSGAESLRMAYGFAATEHILDAAAAFARDNGKNLLLILLCPTAMCQLLRGQDRYDQRVADVIAARGWPCFDMNLVHLEDFRQFAIPVDEYINRYFIGHYSPAGNHFFAMSIRKTVVDWLDPQPVTYRAEDDARIAFDGYLPD